MLKISKNRVVFAKLKSDIIILEYIGLVGIFLQTVYLLNISWKKWCDPQIDYGRELYIPWRMSEGDKWLKDLDDLYGPLSRFFDAGLFKLFGPGIMVLAWANIIIYFIILSLIYILFKKSWGLVAALISCYIFVGVFSFSQLTIVSNYNFVTPYSQQVTHGFLVCLLLVWILPDWIKAPTVKLSFFVGLMIGLTAVLKPEFVLASILIIFIGFLYHFKIRGVPQRNIFLAGLFGFVLPTLLFLSIFATYLPIKRAVFASCYAWLNGLYIWKDELTAHLLNTFSGMDYPKIHFVTHAVATGWAFAVIGCIVIAGYIIGFIRLKSIQLLLVFVFSFVVVAIGLKGIVWINVGQSLLGLLLIYSLCNAIKLIIVKDAVVDERSILRTLLSVLALALMTRMLLNGRIFQYGFIQASLAAIVVGSVIIKEFPSFLRIKGLVLLTYKILVGLLFLCGVVSIMRQSQEMEQAKTFSVGSGKDLFYTFPKTISPDGEIVSYMTEKLNNDFLTKTLVVMPEGIMINYLTRIKSTVGAQAFYTNKQEELDLVNKLDNNCPGGVVFITRDLTEYGVSKFGAKGQSGEALINWLNKRYQVTATIGQDPLQGKGAGGQIYKRIK